jgi:hypothetical protein
MYMYSTHARYWFTPGFFKKCLGWSYEVYFFKKGWGSVFKFIVLKYWFTQKMYRMACPYPRHGLRIWQTKDFSPPYPKAISSSPEFTRHSNNPNFTRNNMNLTKHLNGQGGSGPPTQVMNNELVIFGFF